MNRKVSVFIDNYYFPAVVPLINSLKYYDTQADIRVYDHNGLNHLLRTYLQQIAEIVPVKDGTPTSGWMNGCKFRPVMLAANHSDDIELCLDCDMIALSNLEWALGSIDRGKFVGSCEWEWAYDPKNHDRFTWPEWQAVAGNNIPSRFNVYNGGLLGFNRSKHVALIDKWRDACVNPKIYAFPPYNNDQMVISGLVAALKIDMVDLPSRYWMTTWRRHCEPRKRLGFGDKGRLKIYDTETGKPVQLYHFTGDIGTENPRATLRYYHAHGEHFDGNKTESLSSEWYKLWEKRHMSPAAIAADMMRNSGPLKVPAYFNHEFRDRMAEMFNVMSPRPGNGKWTQHDVMVRAACVAYDYVDLLGYSIHPDSAFIYKPVKAMLGAKCDSGVKVVGVGVKADITLSKAETQSDSWTSKCYNMAGDVKTGQVAEQWGKLRISY